MGKQFLEKRSLAIIITPMAKSPPETAVIFGSRIVRKFEADPQDISPFPARRVVRFSIFTAKVSGLFREGKTASCMVRRTEG